MPNVNNDADIDSAKTGHVHDVAITELFDKVDETLRDPGVFPYIGVPKIGFISEPKAPKFKRTLKAKDQHIAIAERKYARAMKNGGVK